MKRKQPAQSPKKAEGRKEANTPQASNPGKARKEPTQSPVLAYNFRDASSMSGVRTATIRKWLLEKKIVRTSEGGFDVKELLRLGSEEDEPLKSGVRRSPQAQKSYDQYWTAKAEEKALDVALKKGELIDKDRVAQALIERETVFKNRLLGLPDLFASRLVGCGAQEIKAICTENIMALLRNLAREGSEAYQKAQASKR
jgi:hypothetical protein